MQYLKSLIAVFRRSLVAVHSQQSLIAVFANHMIAPTAVKSLIAVFQIDFKLAVFQIIETCSILTSLIAVFQIIDWHDISNHCIAVFQHHCIAALFKYIVISPIFTHQPICRAKFKLHWLQYFKSLIAVFQIIE